MGDLLLRVRAPRPRERSRGWPSVRGRGAFALGLIGGLACVVALVPSAHAADRYGTAVTLGGIFTQFFFVADNEDGPGEDTNPTGMFNYTRVFVDSRTSVGRDFVIRGYARLIVNNRQSGNSEQAFVEVQSPYGTLQGGVGNVMNEEAIDYPAPQAFLAVGDEIFSAMVRSRTQIPQRDGLTFKRFADDTAAVSYESPSFNGFKLGVGYYPTLGAGEGFA
ncbi:MAG: porin, partial [Rhodospirillaceae bacterium]